MEKLEERQRFLCPRCGSNKFNIIVEQQISEVLSLDGDPIADRTVDKERILSLRCAECGNIILEKPVKKPISRRAWEDFWEDYLANFIMGFEHYVAEASEEPETPEDYYLRGVVKGMWSIYNLIESEMVEGESKRRKKNHQKTRS